MRSVARVVSQGRRLASAAASDFQGAGRSTDVFRAVSCQPCPQENSLEHPFPAADGSERDVPKITGPTDCIVAYIPIELSVAKGGVPRMDSVSETQDSTSANQNEAIDWETGFRVLGELLAASGGPVSSTALKRELERKHHIANARTLVVALRFFDPESSLNGGYLLRVLRSGIWGGASTLKNGTRKNSRSRLPKRRRKQTSRTVPFPTSPLPICLKKRLHRGPIGEKKHG